MIDDSTRRNGSRHRAGLAALVLFLGVPGLESQPAAVTSEAEDHRQIVDHIHGIFDAFVAQDTEAIREKHTADWTGFKIGSRGIVRGIDGYMADVVFAQPMLEYEILDLEVQLYGDIALVYYVAEWKNHIVPIDRVMAVRARSVDIYRRDAKGWNQAGSHIGLLPMETARGNPVCDQCFETRLLPEGER